MLTDPDQYKNFAGITSSDFDAFLTLFIPQIDAAIRTDLNRPIIEKTMGLIDILPGSGFEELILTHNPVQSVEEVRESESGTYGAGIDPFPVETVKVAGIDYCLRIDDPVTQWSNAGILMRLGGVWRDRSVRPPGKLAAQSRSGMGNVKVTYTAGLTASALPPPDLSLAANLLVSQVLASRKFSMPMAMTSEGLSEYHYSLAQLIALGMTTIGTVAGILAKYRRMVI